MQVSYRRQWHRSQASFLLALLPLLLPAIALATPGPGPQHLALVVGESSYTAVAPLAECALSARSVGASLRRAGFDVIDLEDASNGVVSAAMNDLASRLTLAPGSTAIVYACGYAAALEKRSFMLPVESVLQRNSDVLTEGIIARSLQNLLSNARDGLVVLDTTAWPRDNVEPPAFGNAAVEPVGAGQSLIAAVSMVQPVPATTSVAEALINALASPPPVTSMIAEAMRDRLSGRHDITLVAQVGPLPPPLPSPSRAPAVAVVAPPSPLPPPPPPPLATASSGEATPVIPPAPPLPDESMTTPEERKLVQGALAQLGYYDDEIDGVYGDNTRAAMRRYQHELGAPMTGTLTADQATRLVHSLQ